MNDLHEWFQKNDLCPENILYLYRSDRKTVVHRMDGEEAALYAPLHSVLSVLPEDRFLNISKGIAVCRHEHEPAGKMQPAGRYATGVLRH